jgi:hypothetical protein
LENIIIYEKKMINQIELIKGSTISTKSPTKKKHNKIKERKTPTRLRLVPKITIMAKKRERLEIMKRKQKLSR